MEEVTSSAIVEAVKLERQEAAMEVAEVLVCAFGDPNAAEAVLDKVIRECALPEPVFWQEVTTAIAQIRG